MDNYSNAFTEVNEILKFLDKDEYNKIPKDTLEVIEENRNKNYQFILNDDLDLQKQKMLPETKAILFNLFRDYLSTPEQKQKIIRMQAEERRRNEEKKIKQYNNINIFEKNIENKEKYKIENIHQNNIEEKKEGFLLFKKSKFRSSRKTTKGL